MPEVLSASVMDQTVYKLGGNAPQEFMIVSVWLKHRPADLEQAATRIAAAAVELLDDKPMRITLTTGIDLNLASWHESQTFAHKAEEWKARVAKQGAPESL